MKRLITQLALLIAVLCASVQAHAYDCVVDGIYYNLNSSDNTAEVTEGDGNYGGAIKIPRSVRYNGSSYSVTSIGESAFYECSGLTSVTIPNSVTSIGEYAFAHCSGLTSVTIPNSVQWIGKAVFYGCTGLTSIVVDENNTEFDGRDNCNAIIETATNTLITGCKSTIIPNSVESIGYAAFEGCSGLRSVTIPNSVTSINEEAFKDCSDLMSVTISNSVMWIGKSAFFECHRLTSVTIGNSMTSIGEEAFRYCSSLTSVTIPNSVTSIGKFAFYGSGLTSVTIGNSVTSIGMYAFDCGLTSVTCLAPIPPECGSYALTEINKSKCTLYVLKESVNLYKVADQWKDFYNISKYRGRR